MMMKKKICHALIWLMPICFASCLIIDRNGIARIWLFGDEMTSPAFDSCQLSPVSFIALHADGTYTMDFGRFDYGKWRTDFRRLLLKDHDNNVKVYRIHFGGPSQLRLIASDGCTASFDALPSSFPAPSDDPFAVQNNRWRMPATHPESVDELKARLLNHCHFWELYFTWALKDEIEYVDVRSTPTLLKIYGNGAVLKNFDDLPQRWKEYFYDEKDCRQANQIIGELFDAGRIKLQHEKNRYKLYISLFRQLQQALR